MNQNSRQCTCQGHEQEKVDQARTNQLCENLRCCSYCLSDDIRTLSSKSFQNHIINQAKLLDKEKQDIKNLKNNYLSIQQATQINKLLLQMVTETQVLENLIIQFRKNLERQLSIFRQDDYSFEIQNFLKTIEAKYFRELNQEDIYELLNINQNQNSMDGIQLQLNTLQHNLKEYYENIKSQFIDFRSRKYDIQKIHVTDDLWCNMSTLISNNQQYLVFSFRNLINIYDIKINKTSQIIQQNSRLTSFQFTKDSSNLFAGDDFGFVYGYFIKNGFKIFYKQEIHQDQITQIIIQQQYLITGSHDETIIKTDFIRKNQIFKLVGHSNYIISIDYDIQKDIIISTSFDKSIKIWDCSNQNIIIDYFIDNSSQIRGIQLINNQQDILCHIDNELQKFTIDYQYKRLVHTNSYSEDNRILGFQQVNNDQNLLLICDQNCKIFNQEGKLIIIRQYNLNHDYRYFYRCYRHQLDNLNYIILQNCKLLYYKQAYQIYLLRVKDKN